MGKKKNASKSRKRSPSTSSISSSSASQVSNPQPPKKNKKNKKKSRYSRSRSRKSRSISSSPSVWKKDFNNERRKAHIFSEKDFGDLKKYDNSKKKRKDTDSDSQDRKHRKYKRSRSNSNEQKQKKLEIRIEHPPEQRRMRVGHLTQLIFENKKVNNKIDKIEVTKAQEIYNQLDRSGKKVIPLSQHINSQHDFIRQQNEFQMEEINGQFIRVYKPFTCTVESCQQRFTTLDALQAHNYDAHDMVVDKRQ